MPGQALHVKGERHGPGIAKDYEHTFKLSKTLLCDNFLGAHGLYFDLDKKYADIGRVDKNPFIDPAGYKKFMAMKEQDLRGELVAQMG